MALSPDDTGEAVRQLQRRLGAAGYLSDAGVIPGTYCAGTRQAIADFQLDRGLAVTGICDEGTWTTLVEAWWSLGDRPLMLRSPNLRGDDVAELQRILSRLGFDVGRIDGIFGSLAARATRQFQENAGLDIDGVCTADTVAVLRRLSKMTGDGPGIAAVRDSEQARTGQPLAGRRVAVGSFGGLSAVVESVSADLREHGAMLIDTQDDDPTQQGATANLFGADVYVGVEASEEPSSRVAYYAVPAFESAGGRALAHLIERHLRDVVPRMTVQGMRLPILRETKMPAVLVTLGPADVMTWRSQRIADAIFLALTVWAP
ncbi:MAG: peptidoglycan-binding protein [Actinomycetes bacterium]|jgi:N-acetylmuramoyl-L-alanine amidase